MTDSESNRYVLALFAILLSSSVVACWRVSVRPTAQSIAEAARWLAMSQALQIGGIALILIETSFAKSASCMLVQGVN